jgi:hypothetical protein
MKKYLVYSSLSNCVCGFESIISSYSMLHASGVGNNTVLASVSLNLIGKDILGQLFSIPFIAKMSKYGDRNPIKYIRDNVILFEVSNFIECSTPFFSGSMFIPLATLGNIGKNIGYTGLGSFNANVINKLSIDKTDITEIYSKIAIVNTVSFSVGMSFGLLFVTQIDDPHIKLCILPVTGIIRWLLIKKSVEDIM